MNEFRMNTKHTGGVALTGAEAIALTLQVSDVYKLAEVRLTLGAVSADLDDFVISLDSEMGAAWDSILAAPDPNDDLAAALAFRFADPVPPVIFPGDKVKIVWPNAGGKAWAIDIIGTR